MDSAEAVPMAHLKRRFASLFAGSLRARLLGIAALASATVTACSLPAFPPGGGTGTGTGTNVATDSLHFGTAIGANGVELVGESSAFSITALGTTGQIYFRLESAQDMGGRAARLYINYAAGDAPYWQKDYPNPQSYGHILLSSFRVTDVGSYTVHAYLVGQVGPDIGMETHVIDAPLTITQ
jgi:hypothetical protein